MRTAILHIGPPKTGSTSIQSYLSKTRPALLERGYLYPASVGKRNHIGLAALGARETYRGNAMRRAGAVDDKQALQQRLARDLAAEVAAQPDSVHTAIFSSEQLGARVKDVDGVKRLHDLLAPHFDAFRIIAYLRRQDEVAVSRYSTSLRAGGETSTTIFPDRGDEPVDDEDDDGGSARDIASMLERYAAVFGTAAVTPRLFDRSLLIDRDVVTDFLRAIGIDDLKPDEGAVSNPSLRAAAQELVRRYNERVEARGLPSRPKIGGLLRDERYWGRGRIPARAEAEAYLARFAAGNERVRATWFPDRPSLFSTDFSRYPEQEDKSAIADSAVLDVALDVLIDMGVDRLEADTERRLVLAGQAMAGGRLAEARGHYSKILRVDADHRGAIKGLRAVEAADGTSADDDKPKDRVRKRDRQVAAGEPRTRAEAVGDAGKVARRARREQRKERRQGGVTPGGAAAAAETAAAGNAAQTH
ncbi:MAG: hypothetical protein K2X74_11710, partial [Acetobacteraceae bacterium]|nr:hypothetical protein [Acetobacteraceae bacterium]